MTDLTEIANKYGTDKGAGAYKRICGGVSHGYTEFYDTYFSKYKEKANIRILEIGVQSGASIKMYREYFGKNAEIYGVDIQDCSFIEDEHTHFFRLDQGNREQLDNFVELVDGRYFDIIVDDGSHNPTHQLLTLYYLYPLLKDDGMYIIEDLHTSLSTNINNSIFDFLIYRKPCILESSECNSIFDRLKTVQLWTRKNDTSEEHIFRDLSITSILTFTPYK